MPRCTKRWRRRCSEQTGEFEQADQHAFRRSVSALRRCADTQQLWRAAFLYDRNAVVQRAESELEKVTEDVLYDQRANAFVNLGSCVRIKLKNYVAAKDILERAVLMDRNNMVAISLLAEVSYQLVGDYPKAQGYYDQYRREKAVNGQTIASLWLGIRLAAPETTPPPVRVIYDAA